MTRVACFLVTAAISLAGSGSFFPAFATSGPGCLRVVNVPPGDVLNIRKRPNASSPVTGSIVSAQQGIISLRGACKPLNVAWGSRWCPVDYYSGGPNDPARGWVKARFVRDSDCP
jgi:hypothetical protein